MPFAENFTIAGMLTAAQTTTLPASINVPCGFLPNKVELINITRNGTANANQNIQSAIWSYLSPTFTYFQYNAAGAATLTAGRTAVNGISLYDGTQSVLLGPQILGGAIAKASSTATTLAAHGLQVGDVVLMTNNAVMKQIGGIYFTVATVPSTTTFTIPIDLTGLPADETSFVVKKLQVGPLYYPQNITIAGISAAAPMVVSTTQAHGLTVGQRVRLKVPARYAMTQADGIQGTITAVTTFTFTLGAVNSSAFTAFAYPPTAANAFAAATFPQVIPVGSGFAPVSTPPYWNASGLGDAETNVQFQGFTIGTGLLQASAAGTPGFIAGDIIGWTASRFDV